MVEEPPSPGPDEGWDPLAGEGGEDDGEEAGDEVDGEESLG